jgi:hypothetical protein
VFKREDFTNGTDTAMRNTIGSPLKTNQGDLNPFSPSSPIDQQPNFQNNHPQKKSHLIEPTNLDFNESKKLTDEQLQILTNKGPYKNNLIVEERKEEAPLVIAKQPSLRSSNTIMGFGGIPITYTMRMRERLPALIPENQSYSIWSILKGAIGKDMTKITMPIWLNEPISMLQKISEITSFHKLMDKAVAEKDPIKRTGYVACFLIA